MLKNKIKPLEYPIVTYYLDEIEKTKKHFSLSVVLLAGTLSELIIRELSNDSGSPYAGLLKRILKRKLIGDNQFKICDEIKLIRNRYVHVNIGKMIKKWHGLAVIDKDGLATFSKEVVLSSVEPEKEIPNFYSIHLKADSERILFLLKALLKSFD